jgi:hypothetical protein
MNIGLVTNWDQRCAVAEYAKDLVKHALEVTRDTLDLEFKIVTPPLTFESVQERVADCDIIHYNYCAHAYEHMVPAQWYELKDKGKPVLMTFHEHSDWWTRKLAKNGVADILIIHDKMWDGMPQPENVRTINFGVPEVYTRDVKVLRQVGTFGCAFPWKGLLPLAYACGKIKVRLYALLSEPDSEQGKIGWEILKKEMSELCDLEIEIGWKPQVEVIRKLASCAVLAFPFDERAPIQGISSSVRIGLAAKRPLALTKMAHFRDLFVYGEDIYWASGKNTIEDAIYAALLGAEVGLASIPSKATEDMSWINSAIKYVNLYREVMSGKSLTAGQS